MPIYTYRREDGTTFDIKQNFLDDPLEYDPETGQRVVRLIQPTGIIFKGSGFYVTDHKSKSNDAPNRSGKNGHKKEGQEAGSADKKSETTASESAAD